MKNYTTTKKTMFNTLIDLLNAIEIPTEIASAYGDKNPETAKAELIERIEHEIELASKKSTGKANTAKAEANERLSNIIIEVLSDNKARTVSEIQTERAELSLVEGISNSKVTSLLTALVKAGKVTRITDKKKSYYSI